MPRPTGTIDGAIAYAQSLMPGGKIPPTWLQKTQYGSSGAYSYATITPVGSLDGNAAVYWYDSTGKHSIDLTFDKTGKITKPPSLPVNSPQSWIDKLGQIMSPIPGSKLDPSSGKYDPNLVNAIAAPVEWSKSLAQALSFLTQSATWKRIGIGAVGVTIILIGLVFVVKKGVAE